MIKLLQSSCLDLSSEKHLQQNFADVFQTSGIMRNKSKKMDIFRQLFRYYAMFPEVTAIILATNISITLPPEIKGRPIYTAFLSHGWI